MTKSRTLADDAMDKMWSMLREDANQRGMLDLAILYGWSQIKRRQEILNSFVAGEGLQENSRS